MKAIIIGFMGSGKTTVSRLLAQKLGCRAFDLDEYIVENERRSVKQIFEEDGEDYFRKREHELLLDFKRRCRFGNGRRDSAKRRQQTGHEKCRGSGDSA